MAKQYTYKSLQKTCNELKQKVEEKTANRRDALLAVAAAHALDFLDLAKDNHLRLDMTMKTEENVLQTTLKLHLLNSNRGMTAEDSRMNIVKKLGSYELFTIYNGIVELSPKIQFEDGPNGLLLSYENPNGSRVQFDVYGELEKVLRTFKLSSKGEEFFILGTLNPFYNIMTEQFLKKLQ